MESRDSSDADDAQPELETPPVLVDEFISMPEPEHVIESGVPEGD